MSNEGRFNITYRMVFVYAVGLVILYVLMSLAGAGFGLIVTMFVGYLGGLLFIRPLSSDIRDRIDDESAEIFERGIYSGERLDVFDKVRYRKDRFEFNKFGDRKYKGD